MKVYEFHMAEHFAAAIVNEDRSGLSDKECEDLDGFLEFVTRECGPSGSWDFDDDEFDNWQLCDVSGLYADCVTARYLTDIHIRG